MTTGNLWKDHYAATIDRMRFRANGQYLEQKENNEHIAALVREFGPACYRDDNAFGAEVVDVDGDPYTRDSVDSSFEERFLYQHTETRPLRILDIGAGYGRLARFLCWQTKDFVTCTDPIDVSREVCKQYLSYRNVKNAEVLPPEECFTHGRHYDVAINVHSWPECTPDEVHWWMTKLREFNVPKLMVIPHSRDFTFRKMESPGHFSAYGSIETIIRQYGYYLQHASYEWPEARPRTFTMWRRK